MRYQGKLSSWNDDKGYGFVTPNGGGNEAFVHISAFSNRRRRPLKGDLVTYAVTRDSRNRLRADDVRYVGDTQQTAKRGAARYGVAVALIGPLACGLTVLTWLGRTPLWVPLTYSIVSGVAFIAYGFDKAAALNGRWRTQEGTLHLFGLLGGWPGALIAQQMFHHKSRKVSFQVVFWLTVFLNCGALVWSATDTGAAAIRAVFGAADVGRGASGVRLSAPANA